MSQLLHQNDPRVDVDADVNATSNSQLQFFPEDSPTIGRSGCYLPHSNNSSPRSEPTPRSPRKAAPSPLQTSTTATFAPGSITPARTAGPRSAIQHAFTSPRLPQEPDDLLAAEQSFYTTQESPVPAPPLTSSIDSAISSLSGGHSTKGSTDSQAGSPDIANLVQAAGSPEAVIHYLLKEKASQASQNSQLWRLVDKQRAMILGLNKDLERALRDKERYRKKRKESMAQIASPSPVDSTQGPDSELGSLSSETKSADTKAENPAALLAAGLTESARDRPSSPMDVALAPLPPPTPAQAARAPAPANPGAAEHPSPSQTQPALPQHHPDLPGPGFEAAQQSRKANERAREEPHSAALPRSRYLPSEPPRGPPPSVPPPRAPVPPRGPAVNLIEPSPDSDEGLRSFPAPPRKAPPAPLNLGKQSGASRHLRQARKTGDETDSDGDDILEVDELPILHSERGRRRTREQDDREREMAAAKDADMRCFSPQSGNATPTSRPISPKEGSLARAADPLPTSPRQAVQISPPDAHTRHLSPHDGNAGSLAGILSEASLLASPVINPGLPMSPRPVDRQINSPMPRSMSSPSPNFHSPPLSPRGMGAFPAAVPLSPRAPRQPIPLPPNTPTSIGSPGSPPAAPLQLVSPKPLVVSKESGASTSAVPPIRGSNSIFRGLATEEYPDLLLPPNALPSIDVKVASSRLKPSRASITFPGNSEEDPVFTLAVFARSDGRELWRVEKDSMSLAHLDQTLKQSTAFTAKTPERSLFSGHAPAKVDARRVALDRYLEEILDTPMDTLSAVEICRYLSSNTMEPYADDVVPGGERASESPPKTGPGGRPLRSGYLTKRGKNFGGWKARYFVLDGPVLKYYESPGGPHLGAIKLQNAQIGKQQQQADHQSPSRGEVEDVDNQYRHAFLILEPKRRDSSSLVRHVLCAESDQERDQWVEALLLYVDYKEDGDAGSPPKQRDRGNSSSSAHAPGKSKKKTLAGQGRSLTLPDMSGDRLGSGSYETPKQAPAPAASRLKNPSTPSPPTRDSERDPTGPGPQSQSTKTISGPKNAQVIQDSSTWGNRQGLAPAGADDRVKQKKRSFFGFGSKPRASFDADNGAGEAFTSLSQMAYDQHGPIRPVFGSPLGEAVRYNHPVDVNVALPAVVYRCIEYLAAKNAAGEEGIFRLSGSNVVIKQLRERFNVEGDVNLITDDQYYDIHAVASLLKLYLRELPTTILTRELHLEFLGVTELQAVKEKTSALNGLVRRLPRSNNALLRYLSGFLINIVNHADTNKMTVRNVGIVFSPTLNIPAPVFALFLQQYDDIFGEEPDDYDRAVEVGVAAPPLLPKDIRSPRRQKFQDLPTPYYSLQPLPQSQTQAAFPQPQHYRQQSQRSNHDTGFTPLQPTYEPRSSFPTIAGPEYGRTSQAQTLAGPAYDQVGGYRQLYESENASSQSRKSRRRESSMFDVEMTPRKPSSHKLRDDARKQLSAGALE
ncbi:rhogap with PH domain protein [Diplocarpon rosae]|nr:rhogap with PH domain protein [Diplocarpon rosae]